MLVQTWACKLSILFFALKTLGWGGGGAYPREQSFEISSSARAYEHSITYETTEGKRKRAS